MRLVGSFSTFSRNILPQLRRRHNRLSHPPCAARFSGGRGRGAFSLASGRFSRWGVTRKSPPSPAIRPPENLAAHRPPCTSLRRNVEYTHGHPHPPPLPGRSERRGDWLRGLGVVDVKHAHAALVHMASAGVTLDLLAVICDQLAQHLARCADPDMALNNLDRFVAAARNPLSHGHAVRARSRGPADAAADLLDQPAPQRPAGDRSGRLRPVAADRGRSRWRGEALVDDLVAEVAALEHEQTVLRALRRFKRRETLRIAYGDIIREQSLQTVTAQISYLADAMRGGGPARRLAQARAAARHAAAARRPARPGSSCWAWASSAAAS